MIIKIAKNAGFCFGVERAVNGVMAWAKANKDKSIKVYGMLIHNSFVMDKLQQMNIKTIEDIDQIEDNDIVFIRSHGVAYDEYIEIEKRANKVYDFTCPYVKKIHNIVNEYSNNGYNVIIVGDAEHPEVKGIKGYVNKEKKCFVVKDIEELANALSNIDRKTILVCQTTFDSIKWEELKEYAMQNFNIEIFDTICSATLKRQEEAKKLAREVDVMLVIGDRKSSNTNKLFNLLKDLKPTYFIESIEDLDKITFEGSQKIGITAGASTSEEQINQVVQYLEDKFNQIADEDFERLLSEDLISIRKGEIVKGRVIKVEENYLLVDIGYKSEGIIYKGEIFKNSNVNLKNIFKENDLIEAMVIKESDEEGNVVLSKIKADMQNGFEELESKYHNKETVLVLIKQIKERSIVGEFRGVNVYISLSQWAEPVEYNIIGKLYQVEITNIDEQKKIAFATRKPIIKEENEKRFEEEIDSLDFNVIYEGEVIDIKERGIIVKFKNLTGFVPIREISYSKRIEDIKNYYKIGEKVNVKIIDIDKDKKRIYLSIKKTQEDDWIKNIKKLYLGMIVEVRIIKILNFGLIVLLPDGEMEGFIHISNIPLGYNQRLYNLYKVGDEIKAKVIEIDEQKRRIGLSLKDLHEEDEKVESYNEDFIITIADMVNNINRDNLRE